MDKTLRLYTYIDGVHDTPFPSEENHAILTSFQYDSKRMGGAPTISATLMHEKCLDKLWTYNVYAQFNGEKFFIKQIPSSQRNNTDILYKHEVELVSERVVLDNVYFYDVVSADSNFDRPVSNSSQFAFFGDIREFVARMNESLKYCNVNYTLVVDNGISSESKLVSFENKVISEVLQEIYNTYEIPYYFTGHVIHVGFTDNAITETFKYGVDNSLLSIQKTNANYKIVTRVTGTGSSDNIPYYYPNSTEQGELSIRLNGQEGYVNIINQSKFSKVKAGSVFHYVEVDSLTADLFIGWGNISVVKLEPAEEGEAVKWEISAWYYFSVAQTGDVTIKLGCNIDDSPSPITGVLMREGVEKPLYNFTENTYRINLTPATYYVNIKVEVVDHGNIIENYDNDDLMEYVFDVTSTQFFSNYQGWVLNDPSSSNIVSLYDYGLEISGATVSKGSRLEIIKTGWVQPQGYLMPPIYRQSGGMERFYNAINNKYPLADGGYYEFTNEYIEGKQKEHIVSFENIKPTIKGITNSLGYPIDVFVDFAYDLNDSDDIDEEGNYIHPYFFAKLRKFDGEYGFNLFEHAIQGNEMTISMTSGPCGACEFTIMVDNDTMQNTVQVDKDGNLYRDEEGNVLFGSPQEQQNDTRTHNVWIALKKDINTFGVVMPNATHNYKPRRGDDTFVILHIELPQAYITAAEYRLMQELIKYMKLNNDEKFNFSIAFSRIFFAENPDVLALLNENSRLQIEYNNERYELYVSSFSYKMKSNEPLPEITVELSDTLTISQNALQTSIDKIKQDVMQSVGSIDWLKLGLAYFLRKDQKDRTRHCLASDEGFEIGNFVSGVSGAFMFIDKQTLKSVLEIDKLYVRVKAYFEQLEIVNVNSIGGKQIISPAGGIHITKVEDGENAVDEEGNEYYNEWPYFRCYFTAEQDGESVGNRWHIGDLAYCKAFNLNTTSTSGGSRYYWRKVVNIGVDYIDLSRADCDVDSDKPVAGDVVCQRGNADDVDRQNFIEFSSVDSFSPSITLYQGINSYSLLGKEMIQYGVEKTTGKAFMYVYGDMYVGNRDGSSFIKYTPETGVQIKGTLDIGTKFGDKTLKEIIDSAGNVYKEDLTALQTALNKEMQNLQSQIDGAIETWFYDPAPTLENAPAKEWTTDEKRNIHLGDLYYSGEGRAYRFQLDTDTNTYYWNEIVDTDIKKALENAKKAQDTADGKRKIFARQPQHGESYDIGDMWVNATYPSDGSKYKEDMLRAVTANDGTQPFDIAHWQLASKYTDDTVANQALDSASKANEAVQKLEQGVKDFKDNVEGAFRDGIIDESETQALDANMKQIGALKDQVEKSYADIATNSLLAGSTELTTLGSAKSVFLTACQELLDAVAAAIADKVITDTERIAVNAKYDNFNTKYGDYNKALNACIRYVEEKLNESISTYSYLKEALKQETTIAGGLVQTTSLVLGYKGSDGAYNVMAGSNGLVTAKGNKTPAFWMGGDMIDLFDVYNSSTGEFDREAGVRYAQGMDRMDGTGYRANGNLWWDSDGRVHADPLSFFVGDNSVGGLLASLQVVFKADGIHPDYLIPKVPFQDIHIANTIRIGDALLKYDSENKAVYVTHVDGSTDTIGFYAEGWVSAKGVNSSSSGGGGGASALYQLNDVAANGTNDGVLGAATGKVLMYNGSKWQAGSVVTDISTLTLQINGSALATFDGKSNVVANIAVPTKLSQLTDDVVSGKYLPLSGGKLTGALTLVGDKWYYSASAYALDLNNSDVIGVNSIYFNDLCDNAAEGIHFYRDATHVDSLWVKQGTIYFNNYRSITSNDTTGSILLHSGNYNNYAPSLTGTGASGSWGISISGNASTASKWQSARTLTLTGSVTGSVSIDGSANISMATTTNHTHTFASLTSKPTTISGYGITDAITKKFIIERNDFQHYVILLCKIGANSTNTLHTINGTIWSHYNGAFRYQAAYVNIHCSDWKESYNNYYNFTPFGIGTKCRLVTCKYKTFKYLAIAYTNTQACTIYFDGSYSNIDFTPVLYYTSYTEVINNSEIYNSIEDVKYNKLAFTSDNVASATQLQTSRTLWGQPFNGTANISGTLTGVGGIYMTDSIYNASNQSVLNCTSNWLILGYGSSKAGLNTYVDGNIIYMRCGTSHTNALTITSSGLVGIGTNSPKFKLHIHSDSIGDVLKLQSTQTYTCIAYQNSGTYTWSAGSNTSNLFYFWNSYKSGIVTWTDINGNFATVGGVTAKASSSDIRLKKDIRDYNAMEIIRRHRSIKYHWNEIAKANADIFNDDYWHFGLIAQEVEHDLPQMVSNVFGDYLVIQYERLLPIMWRGLQEVDSEIDKLKRRVKILESTAANWQRRASKLEMELNEIRQNKN